MTNELEKRFFDTFGIEPREFKSCDVGTFCPYPEKECGTDTCPYYRTYKVDYPQISDRILLELICIYLDYRVLATQISVKDLKQTVLQGLIELHKQYNLKIGYYEEVRTLFEEG